jgi:leader peptidase (prepilin peptidase)/N-methyltransferase
MVLSLDFVIGFTCFILGLLIGSFLNVVIYRVPLEKSVVFPNSFCPNCSNPVKPYDNIPVLSYLILGGKCRFCKIAISPIYPAVELLVGILYLLCFFKVRSQFSLLSDERQFYFTLLADIVFVSLIVPLVFIDLQHQLLPDVITKPGILVMTILRVLAPDPVITATTRATFNLVNWSDWAVALLAAVIGALVGGGSLWLVREAYFRLRKQEGMGLGDVKMMLFVGAFLGWQLTLLTIFLASLIGSIIGVILMLIQGRNMQMKIPFGVFLGPAAILSLFIGQPLIAWYIGMYR